MSTATALPGLLQWVADEGEPLASRLRDPDGASGLGQLVAQGPRTSAREEEYTLVLEAIREGYLCHYGTARIVADPDPDLLLLAGDLFYAFGIRQLAGLEDLESVGILSDLIRTAADLQARGEPQLAERLWPIQIMALACGCGSDHEALLKRVEAGDTRALDALEAWSDEIADTQGLGRALNATREAIDFRSLSL